MLLFLEVVAVPPLFLDAVEVFPVLPESSLLLSAADSPASDEVSSVLSVLSELLSTSVPLTAPEAVSEEEGLTLGLHPIQVAVISADRTNADILFQNEILLLIIAWYSFLKASVWFYR